MTSRRNKMATRFAALCFSMVLALSLVACGGDGAGDDSLTGEASGTMEEGAFVGDSGASGNVASSAGSTGTSHQKIDVEALLQARANTREMVWSGVQYYQGKAVSIYRQHNGSEDLEKNQSIFIRDEKNLDTLVVENAPSKYTDIWFVTEEGYCIAIVGNILARIEADGTEAYQVNIGAAIPDICQLSDGRIMLLVKEGTGTHRLAELNAETGEHKILDTFDFGRDSRVFIAAHEDGLMFLNSKGFWRVNLESGELTEEISMSIYNDILPYAIKDFKVLGGMTVEFLRKSETLVWMPADIEKYRQSVVIQCAYNTSWMQAMVDAFNRSNYQYYAVLEKYDRDSGSVAEYQEGIEKQVAAGGGADILALDSIDQSYFIDMGWLEDLAPYMERSGMDILDYFPVAFEKGKRGNSIYSADLTISMSGLYIKEEILGNRQEPSVEYLMNCLLDYTEPSVLSEGWRCKTVLHYLLAGSDDLWGCIDWENRTCDFMSDFFAKALEVSLLFGDEGNNLPAVADIRNTSGFYDYINDEQMDLAGEYYIGYIFEDGCRPWMVDGRGLAINSNSNCKDAAWAVLEYFLSEEGQLQKDLTWENGTRFDFRYCPVNVYAFEEMVLLEQEETALYEYQYQGDTRAVYKGGKGQVTLREDFKWDEEAYRARYNIKTEDIDELREQLYEVRYMPGKPAEILDIIYEEAKLYFWGRSSVYDVCESIQEKVQAYLDAYEE